MTEDMKESRLLKEMPNKRKEKKNKTRENDKTKQ